MFNSFTEKISSKIISYVVILCMFLGIFSCVPFINTQATAAPIWDGTAASSYAGGTGTEANPYLISNGQQLLKMMVDGKKAYDAATAGSYYKLTDDIYLNDISDFDSWETNPPANNWGSTGDPNGNFYAKDFVGNVDGQGYTIYGLYCNEVTGTHYKGLFSQLSGSLIKNLNLSKVYVSGVNPSGAITGRLTNQVSASVISGCSVTDAKIVSTKAAGGFVGANSGSASTITDCCFNGSVSAGTMAGGIVGDGWSATLTVNSCYTVGVYPCGDYERGNYSFSNVYTDTAYGTTDFAGITLLESDKMQGENALETMSLSSRVWKATETYPITIRPLYEVWDGTAAESYAGGSGTEADPYLVSNGEQLLKMMVDGKVAYDAATTGSYYKLTADIYLNDIFDFAEWSNTSTHLNNWGSKNPSDANTYEKNFTGNVDGQGYTIYGLYCNEVNGGQPKGLFSRLSASEIKNLNISNSYIYSLSSGGAIAGLVRANDSFITGCSVTDTKVTARYAGGILGQNASTTSAINNCAFIGSVTAKTSVSYTDQKAGGIVADGYTKKLTVSNSYSVGIYPCGDDADVAAEKNMHSFSNVYTDTAYAKAGVDGWDGITILTNAQMQGADALANMKLSSRLWETTETYPMPVVEKYQVWDGTAAESYAGGSGTEADPYLVSNGEQLLKMMDDGLVDFNADAEGSYYKLTDDIYLNDISYYADWSDDNAPANNWGDGTNNNYNKNFTGHVDGRGYTVYGLYCKENYGTHYKGLFSQIKGSTIENLNVAKAYFSVVKAVGGLVGRTTGAASTISGCSVTDTTIKTTAQQAGGILGANASTSSIIKNCRFIGDADSILSTYTEATAYCGGIVADSWTYAVSVLDSYSIGYYPSGKAGDALYAFMNVSTDTQPSSGEEENGVYILENADMQGEAAVEKMLLNKRGNEWLSTEGYPVYSNADFWNGVVADFYASGDGTSANPYIISNAAQLRKMINDNGADSNGNKLYFELSADLILNDSTATNWTASAHNWYNGANKEFVGEIKGAGNTIVGLYADGEGAALIEKLGEGAAIKNLHLSGAVITAEDGNAAAIAAENTGNATISGCSVYADVTVSGKNAAGIIAKANDGLTVSNCRVLAVINGENTAAAVYAVSDADAKLTVSNVYSVGSYPVGDGNAVLTNVYYKDYTAQAELAGITKVENYSDMLLDNAAWYGLGEKAPLLRNRGMKLKDISADDNDILDADDMVILTKFLLDIEECQNIIADINDDGESNILDFINLKKKIQ